MGFSMIGGAASSASNTVALAVSEFLATTPGKVARLLDGNKVLPMLPPDVLNSSKPGNITLVGRPAYTGGGNMYVDYITDNTILVIYPTSVYIYAEIQVYNPSTKTWSRLTSSIIASDNASNTGSGLSGSMIAFQKGVGNEVVVCYASSAGNYCPKIISVMYTATTVSVGTAYSFPSGYALYSINSLYLVKISDSIYVALSKEYNPSGGSNTIMAIAIKKSGTTYTFGGQNNATVPYGSNSSTVDLGRAVYLSEGYLAVMYHDSGGTICRSYHTIDTVNLTFTRVGNDKGVSDDYASAYGFETFPFIDSDGNIVELARNAPTNANYEALDALCWVKTEPSIGNNAKAGSTRNFRDVKAKPTWVASPTDISANYPSSSGKTVGYLAHAIDFTGNGDLITLHTAVHSSNSYAYASVGGVKITDGRCEYGVNPLRVYHCISESDKNFPGDTTYANFTNVYGNCRIVKATSDSFFVLLNTESQYLITRQYKINNFIGKPFGIYMGNGKLITKGQVTGLSGLVAGAPYGYDASGNLIVVEASDPTFIGTAISDTVLDLKGFY